ncbi:MAG TPA: carbonic anhydrase [Gammaproteobacteria bacterium]|nr:carbonic anhydrase [Gammaproteobacteria bacterium]
MEQFVHYLKSGLILFLLSFSTLTLAGSDHAGAHWGYGDETGPAHWGDMKPGYSTCKTGKHQSPINISGAHATSLPAITFRYQATLLNVVNNGHAIQVNYAPGSYITVAGKRYKLLQIHFHSPSEHEIDGKAADMVAHLVHKAADGQLAVVAVLFNKGSRNPLIEKIWKHMPTHKGEYSKTAIKINASDLLPTDRAYYHYSGSLTTPPCSEGVNWLVLKNRVEVSSSQIDALTHIFPKSTRPVQPLNGRRIEVSR